MTNISEVCHLVYRDDAGCTSAVVAPAWGANVIGFSYQSVDWLWPIPVLEAVDLSVIALKPSSYGAPVLCPTPGRVGHNQSGEFVYNRQTYKITPARHGFLRNLPWSVTVRSASALACSVEIKPAPTTESDEFPFDFRATHEVEVGPRRLTSRVRIENTGSLDQPIDVGWHPYFHRTGRCKVCIPASYKWELNSEPEPTPEPRLLAVVGKDDFRDARTIDQDEHWDDIFTSLETDEDGRFTCWIEEDQTILLKDVRRTPVTVRRGVQAVARAGAFGLQPIRHMQLYTPPGRQAISLEPLSAPPNALNLRAQGCEDANVCDVTPGAEVTFEIALTLSLEQR